MFFDFLWGSYDVFLSRKLWVLTHIPFSQQKNLGKEGVVQKFKSQSNSKGGEQIGNSGIFMILQPLLYVLHQF